jgi:SAM-dependent methyltransferase
MSDTAQRDVLKRLWMRLRCPACTHPIPWDGYSAPILCSGCQESFPVLPGHVPLLLATPQRRHFASVLSEQSGGVRMADEYRRRGTWKAKICAALKPPSIVYDEDLARRYSWIYDTHGIDTVVLSIGGGPGRENPRVINLNIDAFDSVDIVGDGTCLPLEDDSVDTVTCNAVIEHVQKPAALVSEMRRVVRPGGHVQMMIPFVFPFHEYPGDYQRYTQSGIEVLTAGLDTVDLSVLTGPTSALLVFFREYVRLLVPGGNSESGRLFLNGLSGWLTFFLKHLDRRLNRKPEAAHLAAAFYYLGRKPDSAPSSPAR